MPYNPGISYDFSPIMAGSDAAGRGIQRGLHQAGDALGQGIYLDQKEKKNEKEEAQKQRDFLEGVDLLRENDPTGTFNSLMGGKSAHELGYGATSALIANAGEMAKIGRGLLDYQQTQTTAMQQKQMEDYEKTASETSREFITNQNFDPIAFGRTLIQKGMPPEVAAGAVKTFRSLVPYTGPQKIDIGGQTWYDPATGTPLKRDEAGTTEKFEGNFVRYKGGGLGIWDPKSQTYRRDLPPAEGGGFVIDPKTGNIEMKGSGRPINYNELPLVDDNNMPVNAGKPVSVDDFFQGF